MYFDKFDLITKNWQRKIFKNLRYIPSEIHESIINFTIEIPSDGEICQIPRNFKIMHEITYWEYGCAVTFQIMFDKFYRKKQINV